MVQDQVLVVVQPLSVGDNSDLSANRLTALVTPLIHASRGNSSGFPFETARMIVLQVFVFVYLLVVCLFLSLARLGRRDWYHCRPSSSRGGAKRSRLHRLLKPRCPDNYPVCRLASTHLAGGGVLATWDIRSEDRHFEHD
jgi:hypothetical protein